MVETNIMDSSSFYYSSIENELVHTMQLHLVNARIHVVLYKQFLCHMPNRVEGKKQIKAPGPTNAREGHYSSSHRT